MKIIHHLIFISLLSFAKTQFAYPADSSPPQINTTFACFACSGRQCDVNQIRRTHSERTCSGPRVACWVVSNTVTAVYTRMCGQPDSIRQGVFCNRHMEGKEFCYSYASPQGRVRLCAKCCLNNHCNTGLLKGVPDRTLQTCVACNGEKEDICNRKLSVPVANSTYAEQCLLPNSDCWTERQITTDGEITFSRGCQLRTCDDVGTRETCSSSGSMQSCAKCCRGDFCNRFAAGGSISLTPYAKLFFLNFLITMKTYFMV